MTMDAERVYKVHEEIGFPSITEKEQADILIWHDVEIINRLTPGFKSEYIPPAVAKRYVKLTKDRFKALFSSSGYIEKLYDTHLKYPKLDSQWIEKTKDSKYILKVQERGGLVHIEYFDHYDNVINYFVDWIYKTYDY
jgi:hypothetical protein